MTSCGVRVLLNAFYEDLKSGYGIPRSTMTSHMRKISHPLHYGNMSHLQQRMNTGEFSISKLRKFLRLYFKKNKLGRPNCLSPDEEALVVVAAEI